MPVTRHLLACWLLIVCLSEVCHGGKTIGRARFSPRDVCLDTQFQGELLVRTGGCSHDDAHEHQHLTYSLLLPEGEKIKLAFEDDKAALKQGLMSGTKVSLTGRWHDDTFFVDDLEVQQKDESHAARQMRLEIGAGQGQEMASRTTERLTSITFILSICGQEASTTVEKHKKVYFSGENSIQNQMNDCSYGKTDFLPEDNIIVGPIELPCEGGGSGSFREGKCEEPEIYGWAQYAEDELAKQQPDLDLDSFQRRILILPDMPACTWAGLATFGCGRICISWINGDYASSISTIFHEIGHTFGLMHSGTQSNEYGDCSCAMSNCGVSRFENNIGRRCLNSAYSWNLGWSENVAVIKTPELTPGVWEHFFIPAMQASHGSVPPEYEQNSLRIVPVEGDDEPSPSSFFVSYREREHGDVGLREAWGRRIYIHKYGGKQQKRSTQEPVLLKRLESSENWVRSDLVIRFDGIRNSFASVRVCRFIHSSSQCDPQESEVRDNSPACPGDKSLTTSSMDSNAQDEEEIEISWAGSKGWQESCSSDALTSTNNKDGSARSSGASVALSFFLTLGLALAACLFL